MIGVAPEYCFEITSNNCPLPELQNVAPTHPQFRTPSFISYQQRMRCAKEAICPYTLIFVTPPRPWWLATTTLRNKCSVNINSLPQIHFEFNHQPIFCILDSIQNENNIFRTQTTFNFENLTNRRRRNSIYPCGSN